MSFLYLISFIFSFGYFSFFSFLIPASRYFSSFFRLVVNFDPRHSFTLDIPRRQSRHVPFVNRRHFPLVVHRRCPPWLFLPVLPRLFERPGRPVTSRPRSRVSKLRRRDERVFYAWDHKQRGKPEYHAAIEKDGLISLARRLRFFNSYYLAGLLCKHTSRACC